MYRQSKGTFLVLEGIDGSGKSTQRERLSKFFQQHNIETVVTREPGGTLLAEDIRRLILRPTEEKIYPETELLMMTAARVQHVNNVIKPAIKAGKVVICDRFIASTYAYQVAATGEIDEDLEMTFAYLCDVLKGFHSDLTFFFDVSLSVAIERLEKRGEINRLDTDNAVRLANIQQGYKTFSQLEGGEWEWIDADQSEEQVFSAMLPRLMEIVNHHKARHSH